MKHTLLAVTALLLAFPAWTVLPCEAKESEHCQGFDAVFEDATLRLDYVFCGDAGHQAIYFQRALRTSVWAGRRSNLSEPLLEGNGQIRLLDPESGECLYANSFSTLFQEWQVTTEALHVQKAFENCFQVPFPRHPVDVEIFLVDTHRKVSSRLKHRIDPSDILIRRAVDNGLSSVVVSQGGTPAGTVDIVVISDGYAASEKAKFFGDAGRVAKALFRHEPFASCRDRFTVRAVFAPSPDSGTSIPRRAVWKDTPAETHFDTFYSDRYLTTSSMQKVYDLVGTVPFEHVVVLVNTPIYGGGGIYNSVTIMPSDNPTFNAVMVHEFGHAFAGLADEYAYGDQEETSYPSDTEPWEPNVTTLHDFAAKWQDLLPAGTSVPTEPDELDRTQDVRRIWHTLSPEQKRQLNLKLGVYEGAGYQLKGVYRPVQECRMRINECEEFCPVCTRAILRMIDYYTR